MMPFTLHPETYPISFQLCLSQDKHLKVQFSENISISSLFAIPFIPPNIPCIQPIYTISPSYTGLTDALIEKKKQVAST